MKLRTQKQISNRIPDGTPPPLMSKEGDEQARKLGAGLTFEAATRIQPALSPKPSGKLNTPDNPANEHVAPLSAYQVHTGMGEPHRAPVASEHGPAFGTEFTSATTKVKPSTAGVVPAPMSSLGNKLAAKSGPESVF
jgi:hypothetical protein